LREKHNVRAFWSKNATGYSARSLNICQRNEHGEKKGGERKKRNERREECRKERAERKKQNKKEKIEKENRDKRKKWAERRGQTQRK
jgi:hypothetical protein